MWSKCLNLMAFYRISDVDVSSLSLAICFDESSNLLERLGICSCNPEEEERFKGMQERVWRVHHPDEPMLGAAAADEDEDIVLADAGTDLARNVKCPITAVEVRPKTDTLAETFRILLRGRWPDDREGYMIVRKPFYTRAGSACKGWLTFWPMRAGAELEGSCGG